MPHTIWIASYPKSGNTWFRIFLANLLYPDQAPIDLNRLPLQTPLASSRYYFDEILGVPSALLTPEEVLRLRPAANLELNRVWESPLLLRKVHDAYTWLDDGRPLFGRAPDFKVLYILRDPWDVAISMTNHFDCTPDEAVEYMCDSSFSLSRSRKRLHNQLTQRLLSWEGHVSSWLHAPLRLHLLRYEQMRHNPLTTFRGAVRFLGLDYNDRDIEAALKACHFELLQHQEKKQRFRETPKGTSRFFRSGTVGEGLGRLSAQHLQRLETIKQRIEQVIAKRELLP